MIPVSRFRCIVPFNELDEARFVVNRIRQWHEQGGALADCAILYRSNAQSRVLEEALLQSTLPYRIYGDALLRTTRN